MVTEIFMSIVRTWRFFCWQLVEPLFTRLEFFNSYRKKMLFCVVIFRNILTVINKDLL